MHAARLHTCNAPRDATHLRVATSHRVATASEPPPPIESPRPTESPPPPSRDASATGRPCGAGTPRPPGRHAHRVASPPTLGRHRLSRARATEIGDAPPSSTGDQGSERTAWVSTPSCAAETGSWTCPTPQTAPPTTCRTFRWPRAMRRPCVRGRTQPQAWRQYARRSVQRCSHVYATTTTSGAFPPSVFHSDWTGCRAPSISAATTPCSQDSSFSCAGRRTRRASSGWSSGSSSRPTPSPSTCQTASCQTRSTTPGAPTRRTSSGSRSGGQQFTASTPSISRASSAHGARHRRSPRGYLPRGGSPLDSLGGATRRASAPSTCDCEAGTVGASRSPGKRKLSRGL